MSHHWQYEMKFPLKGAALGLKLQFLQLRERQRHSWEPITFIYIVFLHFPVTDAQFSPRHINIRYAIPAKDPKGEAEAFFSIFILKGYLGENFCFNTILRLIILPIKDHSTYRANTPKRTQRLT